MAFLGRSKVPQPPPADAQLAALEARVDQALATIDDLVRSVRPGALVPGRHVADWLLDVRNKLHPPPAEDLR